METEKNPWKITNQETVLNNPWIKVTHHDVINPSGNIGIYDTVHFKNIAIGILPIDKELNTYLVGQFRFPHKRYSWEIPEGGGELNTSPIESAKRELKEETGLIAQNYLEIGKMDLSNSVSDESGIIYLATDLKQAESEPEETEVLEIKKLPFKEAYKMVLNNEITDSLSVYAILRFELMLRDGFRP